MRCVVLLVMIAGAVQAQVPRVLLPDLEPGAEPKLADPAALAERIAKTSRSASDKLAEAKTEKTALNDQRQVKDDLDELIRMLEQPPPPSQSSSSGGGESKDKNEPKDKNDKTGNPPPKGGTPPPKGGDSKPMNAGNPPPKPGSPDKPNDNSPKPMPNGKVGNGASPGMPTTAGPALPNLPLEESLSRDFWGHLPDAQRAQMLQFYREQSQSKYKDLLAEYYKALAEKEKKSGK